MTFPSESGVEAVTGKTAYTHAEIHDYKTGESGKVQETEDGTWYNVHSWLKVEYKWYDGKSRTLYIELYSSPEYAVVKVMQDK